MRNRQSVQNTADRLITNNRKLDHITPVLRDLHWLPVEQWIVFNTAMLVYKSLQGLELSYLTKFCQSVSTLLGRRQLRSGTTGIFYVVIIRTSIGSRSFTVAGPVTWNSLPAQSQTLYLSVGLFAKQLKTKVIDYSLLRTGHASSIVGRMTDL